LGIDASQVKEQLSGAAKDAEKESVPVFSKVGKKIGAALGKGAEKEAVPMFSKIGKKIGLVFGAALSGTFIKSCLDLGSDLSEVQNVVDTTFTSMSQQVNKFAQEAMTNFGLSETVAKRYVGTLGTMSKSMGFTEQQAYGMATEITGLAGDVASFYNLSTDEAYNKLKSIWTGETEAIKELGVVMTQTALDQYAMNNGFGKTTANMTEQEKVMLRYRYVMSSLSGAQGDFAKTSGSWANQTRILSLQFDSLKASLGQGFINLFTPIIRCINALLGKLITLANAFKRFTELLVGNSTENTTSQIEGISGAADEASSGISGMGDAAAGAAKKAEKALAGFDEITKIGSESSKGSAGLSGAGAFGLDFDIGAGLSSITVLDETDDKISGLVNKLKELGSNFKKSLMTLWNDYGQVISEKFQDAILRTSYVLKEIWEGTVKPIWDNICEEVDWLWEKHLKPLWDNVLDFVGVLIECALQIYNQCIMPIVNCLNAVLGPTFSAVFNFILDVVSTAIAAAIDIIDALVYVLKGVIKFLTGVFTGDWKKAWSGIADIFKGIWKGIETFVNTIINFIIDILNGMMSGFVSVINGIIRGINSIGFTMPDWMGGYSWTPGLQEFTAPQIPKLAEGGIVQAPTLAMIGEAGKEAVMPLENNTGWIKNLAHEIYSQGGSGKSNGSFNDILKEILNVLKEIRDALNEDAAVIVGDEEIAMAVLRGIAKLKRRYGISFDF